jgi:ribose-phosphate pyrophosphokinase
MTNQFICVPNEPNLLADRLATLGWRRATYTRHRFMNGNLQVDLHDPGALAGDHIAILFGTFDDIGNEVIELGLVADALCRVGVARTTTVLRYMQYSRGNRVVARGSSLGAKVYIKLLEALAIDDFLVFDLHAPELNAVFSKPVVQMSALPSIVLHLQESGVEVDYVVGPDRGRYDECMVLAGLLDADVDLFFKRRHDHSGASVVADYRKPHLRNKRVLLYDDEIGSGSSAAQVAARLAAEGVAEIHVAVLYSLCTQAALDRLAKIAEVRTFTTTNIAPPVDDPVVPFDHAVVDCASEIVQAFGLCRRWIP